MKSPLKSSLCIILAGITLNLSAQSTAPTNSANPSNRPPASPSTSLKTGEWTDPEKVLSIYQTDNLPVEEVAQEVRRSFDDNFDVVLPFGSEQGDDWNWKETPVTIRLKNVKASEVFNAMNMAFDAGQIPLRWELVANGTRPTALLRNLHPTAVDPVTGRPKASRAPAPEQRPVVFFVGELVASPGEQGMNFDQVVKTISEICEMGVGDINISAHRDAQILIVRGTAPELAFVQSTLGALRDKARLDAAREHSSITTRKPAKTDPAPNNF